MPLHDHFRPPLYPTRRWASFHGAWAGNLAAWLNTVLPEGFYAEPFLEFVIETDVAAMRARDQWGGGGGWQPSSGVLGTISIAAPTDTVEVQVFQREDGAQLAGCIELVSESNKKSPLERRAFATKCASYLHRGAGVAIVDAVTSRRASLHAELLGLFGAPGELAPAGDLYASAYRPQRAEKHTELTVWHAALELGQPLPDVPLWLHRGPCIGLALEATYLQTWRGLRMPLNGET